MNILIIKLGAKGDVLRSTVVLRALKGKGKIFWLTSEAAIPLLDENPFIYKVISSSDELKGIFFDLVLNMEDNLEGCRVLDSIDCSHLEGFYIKDGRVVATESAKEWWAMSLNGGEDRNELKKLNRKPMQHFFLKLTGSEFNGEEYVLKAPNVNEENNLVGIEQEVGNVWPTKKWDKYDRLKKILEDRGYKVYMLPYKTTLKEYIRDIARCSVIVSGDSLPMHIALALKKKAVAIFGPTSTHEIYDYGRLKKIVAPLDCTCCYKRICDKNLECMKLISAEEVADAVDEVVKWQKA